MSRHTTRLLLVIASATALLVGGLLAASAAGYQLGSSTQLEKCLKGQAAKDHGCYEVTVQRSTDANVTLRLRWDLLSNDEGVDNADWVGGVSLRRWAIAGQWKKYPKAEASFPAGTDFDACFGAFTTALCSYVFKGPKGSLDMVFTPALAGWVYEISTSDTICTKDKESCGPSAGSVQASSYSYVFVFKAWRYKDLKNKWAVTTSCPAQKKRKSACAPAALASLANHIGGADPVDFSTAD